MNQDHLVVKVLTPFSPNILKTEVSLEIVESLNKQCDEIIENEEVRKKKDCSHKLFSCKYPIKTPGPHPKSSNFKERILIPIFFNLLENMIEYIDTLHISVCGVYLHYFSFYLII